MLSQFQTCPANYFLRIQQGWVPRRKSAALGFGGAAHEGLAAWYKTGELGKALAAIDAAWDNAMPIDDWRTKAKCVTVMIEYTKQYPAETFTPILGPSGPMIEVPFVLDTGMFLDCPNCGHPADKGDGVLIPGNTDTCAECGEPLEQIEYGGIFDGLVDFSGQTYVLEHKTTSMMGGGYFDQFKPNNQVSGYIWGASCLSGRRVQGAIINAIGVYKVGKTKFERSITSRNVTDLDEWLKYVRYWCNRIKEAERTGVWAMNTQACTLYGKCSFHSVHILSHEAERQKRLDMDYVVDKWNFEKRIGTEVKE